MTARPDYGKENPALKSGRTCGEHLQHLCEENASTGPYCSQSLSLNSRYNRYKGRYQLQSTLNPRSDLHRELERLFVAARRWFAVARLCETEAWCRAATNSLQTTAESRQDFLTVFMQEIVERHLYWDYQLYAARRMPASVGPRGKAKSPVSTAAAASYP